MIKLKQRVFYIFEGDEGANVRGFVSTLKNQVNWSEISSSRRLDKNFFQFFENT